jgi:hypothetical protein
MYIVPWFSIFRSSVGAAVLRGSEAALETKKGSLDRQTYVHKLSRSTRATFSVEQDRDRIFDLFEKYLHKLMANNEQDDAGRCGSLPSFSLTPR